jgi:hypothetical protein
MSYILGLNLYHANSSACIISNNEIIAASEEERFTRIKNYSGFPKQSIIFCLDYARITLDQISAITINQNFYSNFLSKLKYILKFQTSLQFILQSIKNKKNRTSSIHNLNLPEKDKGIDAIVSDINNNIYAIQVKYRKKTNDCIPFGELATFQALTFGTAVKNIHKGIFFTNCDDICSELKNDKYINIVNTSFDKCDDLFWKNAREYIGEKPLTKYTNMTPLPHQDKLIPIILNHYKNNDYGNYYSLFCFYFKFIFFNYA